MKNSNLKFRSIDDFKLYLAEEVSSEFGIEGDVEFNQDLVELGLESIQFVFLFAKLSEQGIDFPPADFMSCRSLSDIVRLYSEIFTDIGVQNESLDTISENSKESECFFPGQLWFLSECFPEKNLFNISFVYRCLIKMESNALNLAVRHLVSRFPELRYQYSLSESKISKILLSPDRINGFEEIDLSSHNSEFESTFRYHNDRLHLLIDIEEGILFKLVLFRMPETEPDRILFVVHHLACDGYSLCLLRNELWSVYDKILNSESLSSISLGKNASANLLAEYRSYLLEPETLKKINFWSSELFHSTRLLPGADLINKSNNHNSNSASKSYVFSKATSKSITVDLQKSFDISANEILVAAVHNALSMWSGNDEHLILSVNSARALALKKFNVDVSHEVSWLALTPPLYIRGKFSLENKESLRSIKARLLGIFELGLAYELAFFLNNDMYRLPVIPTNRKVVLNFIGDFGGPSRSEESYVIQSDDYSGNGYGPSNDRATVFMITASFFQGQLVLKWDFNPEIHDDQTISILIRSVAEFITVAAEMDIEQ